jgi:hypothetical protein
MQLLDHKPVGKKTLVNNADYFLTPFFQPDGAERLTMYIH